MIETLKSLPLTFFSPDFYRDLVHQWRGIGMRFILILALVEFGAIAVISFKPMQLMTGIFSDVASSLPNATFKNHKLSIDQPNPYIINLPSGKGESDQPGAPKPNIFIDTDYTISDLAALRTWMASKQVVALITANEAIMLKANNTQLEVTEFTKIPDTVIDHDRWMKWGHIATTWMPIIIGASIALVIFISAFVRVLFGSLLVLLLNLLTRSIPDFAAAMRVAAATAIPVGIIFVLLPGHPWLKLLLWAAYMEFAIYSARKQSPVVAH
jgi:hypothetical protein